MTEAIYSWVKHIIYYMIFLSVVNQLLADSKYEKYIRFFAGMVLILLVIRPFTGTFGLEQQILGMYEQMTLKTEAMELREDLWGMEEKRLHQVMSRYEESVEEDILLMAGRQGITCSQAEVTVDKDKNSSDYGAVTAIRLVLEPGIKQDEASGDGGLKQEETEIRPVEIESFTIEEISSEKDKRKEGRVEEGRREEISGEDIREEALRVQAEPSGVQKEINDLRRKVAQYYEVEAEAVDIQWKDD